jgi:hypothetical protein
MKVRKVLNDGKHLTQMNSVMTFLTNNGYRTPKEIWVGTSNNGIEIIDITKKSCISKVERDNRLFKCR